MTSIGTLRVAVFGATGNIGRRVVEQLLADGHSVTVYVRNPDKLATSHPNLTVIKDDLDNRTAIARAVEGADAVISALGPTLRRGATGTPLTEGTRTIVAAMRSAGVRRFIGLATPAIADPQDRPTLRGKLLRLMPRLFLPNAFVKIVGMTEAVTSSGLEWTIARITAPTDKPASGRIRAGFLGRDKVGWDMSRVDVATFLVGQLTDDTYR